MSKATKRKHVAKEVLDDYVVPDENQQIVKILGSRGNNLHEVETSGGTHFLASMPSKFRKSVWIKRGDFVIVDPIEEGNKVCAEIVHILYDKQIKYLKEERLWPEAFSQMTEVEENFKVKEINSKWQNDSDDDDGLFVNPNHRRTAAYIVGSDSSEDSSNDEGTNCDN